MVSKPVLLALALASRKIRHGEYISVHLTVPAWLSLLHSRVNLRRECQSQGPSADRKQFKTPAGIP